MLCVVLVNFKYSQDTPLINEYIRSNVCLDISDRVGKSQTVTFTGKYIKLILGV
jgi:hypothetical protein